MATPKVYGFDTGFVCAHRCWTSLRPDDLGRLWEHYALNELTAHLQSADLRYWRDKQGHEVDCVLVRRGQAPLAIERKWSARDFDPANLLVFGRAYPRPELRVVTTDAQPEFEQHHQGSDIQFVSLRSARYLLGNFASFAPLREDLSDRMRHVSIPNGRAVQSAQQPQEPVQDGQRMWRATGDEQVDRH